MYKKIDSNVNFVEREKRILEFWKENDIIKKSSALRKNNKTYTFYDGPPTANGKPHIGHVLTRVIKDVIPRFHEMKGNHVLKKAGWDTHGLPVEIEVEKAEGIDGKDDILNYGLEPFINKCKESVWKYKGMWEGFSDTVAFWADMDDPYITYENDYIESVWWSLKEIWNKGLLYRGHKIIPYCPRCGTALSSHEVSQGYKDVKEKSVIVKFRSKEDENTYYLAWTTTPWTLPSNVALTVNAKETYAKVKFDDSYYILAKELIDQVFGQEASKTLKVVEEFKGESLENKEYYPLFDYVKVEEGKKAFIITLADYVTLTDGTGIVHSAPAFGEDDYNTGKKYDLTFAQLVDLKGEFTPEVTDFAGQFVKDADPKIIDYLKEKGLLFATLDYEHSYPHCWRCDSPLIYYAKDTWFIEVTKVKEDLIRNNNKVNWIPESIGTNRFGNWLENVVDWAISRDRFWGTPLNVWECECGHFECIASIEELKAKSDNCPDDIELHRPFIDKVLLNCQKCGGKMKRVEPVIDCWYDSGAMPFAQWHYPFENKDKFEKYFPADFISEAVDQTRGWFYSLLAISTLVFNEAPYKNVIVLGFVLDKYGKKMSKHLGNSVDPFEALDTYGADAIRWYFCNNSMPWLPNKFSGEAVEEGQRKFFGTLWNTYAFYVLYANIDQFNPNKYIKTWEVENLDVMDKWLLSKLNSLVEYVDEQLSNYRITESTRAIAVFVDEMSNWYVRRSRERFWAKDMPKTKIDAYMTLYTSLVTLIKLIAPIVPFISEDIYQNLVVGLDKKAAKSIHLTDFPVADTSLIDKELEKQMDLVLKVVTAGRAARNTAAIKNRQPLSDIYINCNEKLGREYLDIVKEELNIKNISVIEDLSQFTTYKFKPQLKTLGPKYGKLLGQIRSELEKLDGNKTMNELNEKGEIILIESENVVLTKEDLLIETVNKEGYQAESDRGITVVLDLHLTQELIDEGYLREIISKVQTMRKEAGFEVMDYISLYYGENLKLNAVIAEYADDLKAETLTLDLRAGSGQGKEGAYTKKWDINGQEVTMSVIKTSIDK